MHRRPSELPPPYHDVRLRPATANYYSSRTIRSSSRRSHCLSNTQDSCGLPQLLLQTYLGSNLGYCQKPKMLFFVHMAFSRSLPSHEYDAISPLHRLYCPRIRFAAPKHRNLAARNIQDLPITQGHASPYPQHQFDPSPKIYLLHPVADSQISLQLFELHQLHQRN